MNKIEYPNGSEKNKPGSKSFRVTEQHSHPSYSALFPWLIRPHHDEHPCQRSHHHDEHSGPGPHHHDEHRGLGPHHHNEHSGPGPHHHDEYPGPDPHHHDVYARLSLDISDLNREKRMYFKMLMRKGK